MLSPLYERVSATIGGWRRRADFDQVRAYCMFVGYPRSGHSLIGALLNAHPNIVIAHELDALKFAARLGYSRNQLFSVLLDRDQWWRRGGWKWEGWDYAVEGQWQGRYRELHVVGDKAGGLSALLICRNPSWLDRLRETVNVPVKMIHHVRNPFDTIATMVRKRQPEATNIADAITRYFGELVPGVRIAAEWAREDFHEIRHEAFVDDPRAEIARLCAFLGEDAAHGYLEACAARTHASARKSRTLVEWSAEEIDRVSEEIVNVPWLKGYRYDT